ncbi:hypothetical protein GCM10018772_62420 [Streptomyces fumanus]|uniref:Uncharacterized protein n=1 Tax=Streptomyces fumanus TaxID=67302 RepID=A0A919E9V0_9ACTN|nr:hypothetical protein GCM10018772_62420 [Streptomyces fumanus]
MRLDGVHVAGPQTGTGERLPDHPLLGGPIRCRQPVAGAVLIDRTAAYDGQHPMPETHRLRLPLHQQHAHALGPARTVRRGRERLAPTVGRQPALTAELDEHLGRRHDRHTTDEGHRALAVPQRLSREVQGDQRRGARRVHRHGGAFQPEGVRDPAGDRAS